MHTNMHTQTYTNTHSTRTHAHAHEHEHVSKSRFSKHFNIITETPPCRIAYTVSLHHGKSGSTHARGENLYNILYEYIKLSHRVDKLGLCSNPRICIQSLCICWHTFRHSDMVCWRRHQCLEKHMFIRLITHFILKLVQTSCSQFLIFSSNQSVSIKK